MNRARTIAAQADFSAVAVRALAALLLPQAG